MQEASNSTVIVQKERKYTIKNNPAERYNFYCNHCKTSTEHRTVVEATVVNEDCDGEVFVISTYRIVECAGCHYVSFMDYSLFSEDEDFWQKTESTKQKVYIYPILEEGALTESQLSQLQFVLPDKVKAIYEETLAAIKNKLFIIAGIGLRAILDTMCREQHIGEEKDSLDKRLKAMCDKHLISEKEQAVLLKTKDIGNSSAHEGKSLDAYEVEAALIIVEFLLKKIYLLPAIQCDLERGKEKFSIDEVFGDESPEVVSNEQ